MNKKQVQDKIEALLKRFVSATSPNAYATIIPQSLTIGKLYEAHVLSLVIEKLATMEGFDFVLKNAAVLPLKSAPGPINRRYAYFELRKHGSLVAEMWTDIEFLSLSCCRSANMYTPRPGDYHELDIIVTNPGLSGRPKHSEIWLGVECKNTGYTKNLLKEILGIRRELSLLQESVKTSFSQWPRSLVPADPPSCLLVYSTDQAVANYSGPGGIFGIDFIYEPV